MTLLEAIDDLQQKVKDIRLQNTLIKVGSTIAGSALGGVIGHSNDVTIPGTIIGGSLGLSLANLFTKDRENDYRSEVIFGPYSKIVENLYYEIPATIGIICELHRDYSYRSQFIPIETKYNKCCELVSTKELNEKAVKIYRRCILDFLTNSLDILDKYAKEKRANHHYISYYKDHLIPQFRTIEHYLLNAKVKT